MVHTQIARVRAVARQSWSDRQFRAGVDLVTSSAVNAFAGLGFWFVAARGFDEATVGVNAALISTMALVSNLASLGLKNALIRFIPDYGRGAAQLVARTYAVTVGTTFVLAPIAALIISAHVDELDLLHTFAGATIFTIACVIWIIFVLQDSVLVALGETRVIPVANAAHAIAKLLLLIGFAFATWRWGIFFAWIAPVIVVVVGVNVLVVRRFATRTYTTDVSDLDKRALVRFAIGEHAGAILGMGLVGLLPLIVLKQLGDEASAFFAMAWTIAYNLMLANSNVSTAVLAEAAQDPSRLTIQAAKGIRQMSLFVVPGTAALVVLAPFGLRFFGESYAAEATPLLQLLAIAAVVDIPVATAIAMLRATRQVGRLFALYLLRTALVGALCVAFMRRFDLVGVGWGWLLGQSAVAVLLSATLLRPVLIALLPTRIIRMVGAAGDRVRISLAYRRVRPLVRRVAETDEFTVVAASSHTTVISAHRAGRPIIIKIAVTPAGARRLEQEAERLTQLHRLDSLAAWRDLLPAVEDHGSTHGHQWWSQSAVDGVPTLESSRRVSSRQDGRSSTTADGSSHMGRIARLAREAITTLHRQTAHQLDTGNGVALERIVGEPLEAIAHARPKLRAAVEAINAALMSEIGASAPTVSWVHGDLTPGNVLFTRDGASVAGIVDWELAAESLPPEVDLCHFVLALVAESQRIEYGSVVAAVLQGDSPILPEWVHGELSAMPNGWSTQTTVTVAWAHHIAANLAKATQYRTNELWLGTNVDAVVDSLAAPTAATASFGSA